MKSRQRRWIGSSRFRLLGWLTVGGVLGSLALSSIPALAARKVVGKQHHPVSVIRKQVPPKGRLILARPLESLVPPKGHLSLARPLESLVPTDHCVIVAPQVDDKFSIPAPEVDDAFVHSPLVKGLPVSER